MYKKNDKIKLDIVDINNEGLGVSKVFDINTNKNIVFFVKDAIVGDKVTALITKVTKNLIYAKTLEIIEESKYRTHSKCSVANECGGCQIINIDYDKQLAIKKEMVKNNLINIAKIDETLLNDENFDIVGMDSPHNFRNKIIIPFGFKNENIISGYYAGRTHYIIDNDYCDTAFIHHDIVINIVKDLLKKYNISIYDEKSQMGIFRQLMLRKANETNELSVTFIINDKNYKKNIDKYKNIAKDLIKNQNNKNRELNIDINITSISININTSITNVLLGKESVLLYGNDFIKDNMTLNIYDKEYRLTFDISDLSFYQTNIYMTKILYKNVFEFANIKSNESVLDLYCGIGTMTLFASLFSKEVVGVEVIDKAIINAKKNCILNNIDNVNFLCKDLDDSSVFDETNLLNKSYDVLIIDPPRKGLSDAVRKYIIDTMPSKIVYVSCDSATLSRDLNEILKSTNYNIEKIRIVDMFANTMHVETIVLLSR